MSLRIVGFLMQLGWDGFTGSLNGVVGVCPVVARFQQISELELVLGWR